MVKHQWLSCYISDSEVDALAKKVADLERGTSVEIVSMVVERSSVTRHVFWILFGILLIIFFELQRDLLWDLSAYYHLGISLALIFIAGLTAFFLNKSFPRYLARVLTPDRDLEAQVFRRAQLEFHNHQLAATEGKTGVLIFVSILERCVVVLADKSISDKLPKETWTQVVQDLTKELKARQLSKGLTKAVEDVSKLVTPLFPAKTVNPNELTDYLIISD